MKGSLTKQRLAVWQKTVHSLKQKNWIAFLQPCFKSLFSLEFPCIFGKTNTIM